MIVTLFRKKLLFITFEMQINIDMAKRLSVDFNLFEGIKILGLVTNLKDYRLAFSLNNTLDLQLSKYTDFEFEEREGQYSWFYYNKGGNYHSITLINNNHQNGKLLTEPKVDYLLLIKNVFIETMIWEMLVKLRKINGLTLALELQLLKIKNADLLIEALEMHELKEVIRPKKS